MAVLTLAKAEEYLQEWYNASSAVANSGKSYTIKGRSLTRENIAEINKQIEYWEKKVKNLKNGTTSGAKGYNVQIHYD